MIDTRSQLDFPVLRTPPEDVVRGLREFDPTTELVYFGRGRWMLGSVVRRRDLRAKCERIVARALHTIRDHEWRFLNRYDPRTAGRLQFALLGLQGFRPILEYTIQGEPDGRFLAELRRRDWWYRHLLDEEYHAARDLEMEAPRVAAHADLTDPARGRAGHHYMTTINVCPGIPLGQKDITRSGFTRIRSI